MMEQWRQPPSLCLPVKLLTHSRTTALGQVSSNGGMGGEKLAGGGHFLLTWAIMCSAFATKKVSPSPGIMDLSRNVTDE